MRDGLAITMGREGLQVWDITEPMPVLLETIPRRYGKMRLDLMCLTGDADNQLSEFLRREEEV